MMWKYVAAGVWLSLFGAASSSVVAAEKPADSVFVNGHVYTVDTSHPWASAVAIRAGRFVYVGDDRSARRYVGKTTRVIDLRGRMAMPGIHDAHSHILWAGLAAKYGCKLPPGAFGAVQIGALRECEQRLRPGGWLEAGMFTTDQFPEGRPDRKYLDEAFPDRPVFLHEMTAHNGLANSRALALAGIDSATANPAHGTIVRDADGRVTGELIETATAIVSKHIPPASAEQVRTALDWAVKTCNRFGITSLQEASGSEVLLAALRDMEQARALTLSVAVHIMWGSRTFQRTSDEDALALIQRRAAYKSDHVDVDNIKIWLDGTPTGPYYTYAGVDPVTHAPQLDHVLVAPDVLREAVTRFDAAGLRVKMHVAGAGAAHVALDAIEAARKTNGNSQRRHELAHTALVLPEDMDRMRRLNVTGEMSPALWQVTEYLGNPPEKAWPFKTLANHGVLMTVGTDWVVTDEPNLFPPLQGLLEHGDESIDLPLAVRMYTLNGAIAAGVEKDRGSIEAGKRANFIVLDRNLFEIPAAKIGATRVLSTVFEGNVVYSSNEGALTQ